MKLAYMPYLIPTITIFLAAFFFGSQFVPQKFCKELRVEIYNILMIAGIVMIEAIFLFLSFPLSLPGFRDFSTAINVGIDFIFLCFISGMIFALGNYSMLNAISKIGMARSFPISNLLIVVSFLSGILLLGELRGIQTLHIFLSASGIFSILAGAYLVSATAEERLIKGIERGTLYAFLSSLGFGFYNIPLIAALHSTASSIYFAVFILSIGSLFTSLIFGLSTLGKTLYSDLASTKRSWRLMALISGVIWGLGQLFTTITMYHFGVSIVSPIIQGIVVIIGVGWGLLIFRELDDVPAKYRKNKILKVVVGCISVVVGTLLIWVVKAIYVNG